MLDFKIDLLLQNLVGQAQIVFQRHPDDERALINFRRLQHISPCILLQSTVIDKQKHELIEYQIDVNGFLFLKWDKIFFK